MVMLKMENKDLQYKLIADSKNGDEKAFADLIRLYRHNLLNYLWRSCGQKNEAEDLFQETLVKVWQNLSHYDHRKRFAAWLFGIARNVAIDALRKKKVRRVISYTDDLPEFSSTHDAAAILEADEIQAAFLQALAKLPEKQHQVFLLRQHSGMTFKEIAAETGQPLNTVLAHMHYAVNKLKKSMRENDVIR